jgi:hypothetical protein
MPEISRFYGIIIRIFYESGRHQLPHIHAAYGEFVASYSIDPPALLAGAMPPQTAKPDRCLDRTPSRRATGKLAVG